MNTRCQHRWVHWVLVGILALTASGFAQKPATWLTIYSNNLAEVRQQFSATISRSHPEIRWRPVSRQIVVESVQLRSLTEPGRLQVVDQQFRYQTVSIENLLDSLRQQPITLIFENGETVTGTLLAFSGSTYVLKTASGIRLIPASSRVSVQFERLPVPLAPQPELVWQVQGLSRSRQTLEVDYLTRGLDWSAHYIAIIQPRGDAIQFSGLISVDNRLDLAFTNAQVSFIAGEPHRVSRGRVMRTMAKEAVAPQSASAPPVSQQAVFEYHQYRLLDAITLKPHQKHQFPFLAWKTIPVTRHYIFDARRDARHPRVELHFRNQGASGGQPLPAGFVRVYQQQKDGRIFVGEDYMPHTPRKEWVKLQVGRVFDVVGERREVESRQISRRVRERTVEIELRNHKPKQSVTVEVRETFSGEWEILSANFPTVKQDVRTAIFKVTIPADSAVTLKYRVREKW